MIELPGGRASSGQSSVSLMIREVDGRSYQLHGHESILLVDDEPEVRALLARVLRMRGYAVIEASDGEQAIALADEHGKPFHLLLTDVMMPHIGGVELANRLSASGQAARVLFMTGYSEAAIEYAEDATVLRKPFTPSTLAEAVRRALDLKA
jgi:CheY-like chemotaxis protein